MSLTTLDFTQADTLNYANFSAYIPVDEGGDHKLLTGAAWTVTGTTPTVATYNSQLTWTCSGATHTYYGYIVWDDTDDTLLWSEKWASAEASYSGKLIKLTPAITLD